jgi:hypothetical protein
MRILPRPVPSDVSSRPPLAKISRAIPSTTFPPLKLGRRTAKPVAGLPLPANEVGDLHGRCSVCRHKDARAIAMEVISGASHRSVADKYGLSKSALTRHADHLPKNLVQARFSSQIADLDLLLADIVRHEAGLEEIFQQARHTMKRGEAAQISAALLRTFDLLRKMILDQASRNSQPNPTGSEEIAALIGKVFQALQDHPEARIKLAEALSPSAGPTA